jgi:FlaA1/EpsC-like NDP-sugar epimerase
MELESILQLLESRTILITGATGFLAKSISPLFLNHGLILF